MIEENICSRISGSFCSLRDSEDRGRIPAGHDQVALTLERLKESCIRLKFRQPPPNHRKCSIRPRALALLVLVTHMPVKIIGYSTAVWPTNSCRITCQCMEPLLTTGQVTSTPCLEPSPPFHRCGASQPFYLQLSFPLGQYFPAIRGRTILLPIYTCLPIFACLYPFSPSHRTHILSYSLALRTELHFFILEPPK